MDVRIDAAALNNLLRGPSGPVIIDLARRAIRVQNRAKQLCPVDTGRLRASITYEIRLDNRSPYALVGTNVFYAPYQEEGTGIYGPRGTPIRPKRGRFLRFKPRGSNRYVFAREVRGTPGKHFLRGALEAAR